MNAILGMADGYDWPALEPFVRSLRRSGYRDELVLFSNRTGDDLRRRAVEFGIRWVQFDALPHPIDVARYALYAEYLRTCRFRAVLLTDTRDVFFQGNIFDQVPQGVCFFEEDPSMTLGTCDCNHQWLLGCYGVNELREFPILCAGTILGEQAPLQAFLETFAAELKRLEPSATRLVDQPMVNRLVRQGAVAHSVVLSNDTPLVQTLQYVQQARLRRGQVVNSRGEVVRLVHQYDRPWHHLIQRAVAVQLGLTRQTATAH